MIQMINSNLSDQTKVLKSKKLKTTLIQKFRKEKQ